MLLADHGDKLASSIQFLYHPGVAGNFPLGVLARLGIARAYSLETRMAGSIVRRTRVAARSSCRVQACADLWALRPEPPYTESYISLVLPVTQSDKSPAVLKLQFHHPESEHEAEALRRWNVIRPTGRCGC
jgi:hypothetical protein